MIKKLCATHENYILISESVCVCCRWLVYVSCRLNVDMHSTHDLYFWKYSADVAVMKAPPLGRHHCLASQWDECTICVCPPVCIREHADLHSRSRATARATKRSFSFVVLYCSHALPSRHISFHFIRRTQNKSQKPKQKQHKQMEKRNIHNQTAYNILLKFHINTQTHTRIQTNFNSTNRLYYFVCLFYFLFLFFIFNFIIIASFTYYFLRKRDERRIESVFFFFCILFLFFFLVQCD